MDYWGEIFGSYHALMLQFGPAEVTLPRQAASLGTAFVIGMSLVLYQLTSLVLAPSAKQWTVPASIAMAEFEESGEPLGQGAEFALAHFRPHRHVDGTSLRSAGKRRATEFSRTQVQTLAGAQVQTPVPDGKAQAAPSAEAPVNQKGAPVKPTANPTRHNQSPVTNPIVPSQSPSSPKPAPVTPTAAQPKPAVVIAVPLTAEVLAQLKESDHEASPQD